MFKTTLFRAMIAAALLALPLTATAFPSGPPVTMTSEGMAQFEDSLPSKDKIAQGLKRAIEKCDCRSDEDFTKEAMSYYNGHFHHNGYDYGNTVLEYLRAYYHQGKYADADREMLSESAVMRYVSPAINMLTKGPRTRGYLIQRRLMTESAVAESRELLNAN